MNQADDRLIQNNLMITRGQSKKSRQSTCQKQPFQSQTSHAQVVHKQSETLQNMVFEQFLMFSQEGDIDIEGLTYEQINRDQRKKKYLQDLRANLPEYSTMTPQQKAFYFKKITIQYTDHLVRASEQVKDKSSKKRVSFSINQNFVVFDKNHTPEQIRFLEQNQDNTKF